MSSEAGRGDAGRGDAGRGEAGRGDAGRGAGLGAGRALSVSLGLWQDRPAAEVVRTAEVADALGYGEIWIGEMATFDAFALGAVVAERTARAALTIGPLAVAVRDPVMIAMGAGSLAELTGRTVNVALGSSSPVRGRAVARPPPGTHRAGAGRVGHRGAHAAGRRQGRRAGRGDQHPRASGCGLGHPGRR